MKQLRQLVNIHLRSGKDTDTSNIRKTVIPRDSRSSVHEAFHQERSRESRLKSNISQLLRLVLVIKDFRSKEITGNNVEFSLMKYFETDYSTTWQFSILNSGKILVSEIVEGQKLKFIGKELSDKIFKRNTVLFEFTDGYYILENQKETIYSSPTCIRDSYSLNQFKSIKSREELLLKLQDEISQVLDIGKRKLEEIRHKSSIDLKAKEIKTCTRGIEALIIENSHQILGIKGKIYQIKIALKSKLDNLEESRSQGKNFAKNTLKIRSSILLNRNLLAESYHALRARQMVLALELKRVFSLDENYNTVNGIEISDKSDEKISSGYGQLAHLMSVIFGILNIRPRYPMVLKGSRCCIIDYISLRSLPMYFLKTYF